MTDTTQPRWLITYRLADEDQDQTLIIAAESMVTAIKEAQMKLREPVGDQKAPLFRITAVVAAPADDGQHFDFAALQALRKGSSY